MDSSWPELCEEPLNLKIKVLLLLLVEITKMKFYCSYCHNYAECSLISFRLPKHCQDHGGNVEMPYTMIVEDIERLVASLISGPT
jgi:hypothetical protein